MKISNRAKLLDLAVNILNEANSDDLETVDVSETKYDDGSIGISINLTYPAVEPLMTEVTRGSICPLLLRALNIELFRVIGVTNQIYRVAA